MFWLCRRVHIGTGRARIVLEHGKDCKTGTSTNVLLQFETVTAKLELPPGGDAAKPDKASLPGLKRFAENLNHGFWRSAVLRSLVARVPPLAAVSGQRRDAGHSPSQRFSTICCIFQIFMLYDGIVIRRTHNTILY